MGCLCDSDCGRVQGSRCHLTSCRQVVTGKEGHWKLSKQMPSCVCMCVRVYVHVCMCVHMHVCVRITNT